MTSIIWVFIGGGLGSLLRYILLTRLTDRSFYYGTFIANLVACIVLGYLVHRLEDHSLDHRYRLLLATGFCGGLSTFSTLIYELHQYTQRDQWSIGLAYVLASIVGGYLLYWLGYKYL
jgi:fluoride exporter